MSPLLLILERWISYLFEWGNIIFNPLGYLYHIREVRGLMSPYGITTCECKVLDNMVCVECGKRHLTPKEIKESKKKKLWKVVKKGLGKLRDYYNSRESLWDD